VTASARGDDPGGGRKGGVAGVLLTGGASRRLGAPKALLRAGGETLAERAARRLEAVCAPVIEVGPGWSGRPHVVEEPPGSGPLAALVAGARAAGGRAVLLLAVDMPRVEVPLLRLLAAWPGTASVVPAVGGRAQLVCARWSPAAVETAAGLVAAGERSLRALESATEVLLLHDEWRGVAVAGDFADVDTPDDVRALGLGPATER
jgi:molybdopterin-guanine dinucleotide biosynthesis protein A